MPIPSFFSPRCRPKFSISYLCWSPEDKRETESLETFLQLLLSPMPTLCQRGGVTRSQSHYENRKTNKTHTHTRARAPPEADAVLVTVLVVKPFAAQIAAGVQTKGGRGCLHKGED